MKVVLFSGKARHGKDQSAEYLGRALQEAGAKVVILHYADFLKDFCKRALGWNGEKDEAGRTLLQEVGTGVCRKNNPDMWVKMMDALLSGIHTMFDYALIPDARFPNEVEIDWPRVMIRIVRDGFDNKLTKEQANHPSETALDDYAPNILIHNDKSLYRLNSKMQAVAGILENENTFTMVQKMPENGANFEL